MNRVDPVSKRLAPRQPRLLPCRRKTHFRGARHLPKLPAAIPNLQDTCRHHNGLHKVPHWNFVQSSHFHFPINREQYPGKRSGPFYYFYCYSARITTRPSPTRFTKGLSPLPC
ncbi:hypothetical protein L3X38_042136 [Prunus dulcis]|uniref:Uncharacterized protein n=1 Tax=Prunus dulcis TaxID=3755 RepID=A0AAD4UW94_PRUDU|nr:hypothetical protein L3X38_042136 [Prunus dulcis]